MTLINATTNTRLDDTDLYVLAKVKNWQETVPNLVTPAVYDGETLITPAVYEQIPNPYTVQMWIDDYIGGMFGNEVAKAKQEWLNRERAKTDIMELNQLKATIKSNTVTTFSPVVE